MLSKQKVEEKVKTVTQHIDRLFLLNSAQLYLHLREVFPEVHGGTREQHLAWLIKWYVADTFGKK